MKRNFTYSKVMLWVAIDRGLRLADKRSLPCPNRFKWLEARDMLYEDIMHKAWNADDKFFGQSYEEKDVLDAAVLIMPLVFFMQAVSTIAVRRIISQHSFDIPVRPEVREHAEEDHEDAGEGRPHIERKLRLPFPSSFPY